MPSQQTPEQVSEILSRLGCGRSIAVEEFAQVLGRALLTTVEVRNGNTLPTLRFSLDGVRLRNFNQIFMLVGNSPEPDRAELNAWKNQKSGPGRFVVIFSPLNSWTQALVSTFPPDQGYLTVNSSQMTELLWSSDPQGELKRLSRAAISRYRLNPFTLKSTPSNMFFGRANEIEALVQSEGTSFAIAGPGRIGKSSLLQQYRRRLQATDPGRSGRVVYADFFYEDDLSDLGLARRVAIAVNDSKRARELQLDGLKSFLAHERRTRQGPLELLFDEVDRVCRSNAFAKIAEITKETEAICRLILCGRGDLFEAHHDPSHPLHGRVRLMRLAPLSFEDTYKLFLQAFLDLGYELEDGNRLAEDVFRDTNGYPHLVQYLGDELVSSAIARGVQKIDSALFQDVCDRYDTAQFFISAVQDLRNDDAELIALALLQEPRNTFTEMDIAQVAHRYGLKDLDRPAIAAICRLLYIHNVLSWERDHYVLATPALARYARKLGYFAPRLAELQEKIANRERG